MKQIDNVCINNICMSNITLNDQFEIVVVNIYSRTQIAQNICAWVRCQHLETVDTELHTSDVITQGSIYEGCL